MSNIPEKVPRKLIVAGLLFDSADRILITQRPATGAHPLEWELPGGKIEIGESPREALRRELLEEIDLEVDVGHVWDVLHHRYEGFEIIMLVYAARPADNKAPRCVEVADLKWLTVEELAKHSILEADQKLVDRLVAEGVPTYHLSRGR